jgi:carbon monoxide dehydrogenase subunit G
MRAAHGRHARLALERTPRLRIVGRMATIQREFKLRASPDAVWQALADFGAVHRVLARGFVTDCRLEENGTLRVVTFANGMSARERLVTLDAQARRIVYTVEGGRATHHNASAQLFPEGSGTRFVWTTDLLPDALAPAIAQMMDAGAAAMAATLDAA